MRSNPQSGNATLTAVLIMALLAIFTAASLARVTTDALITGNDAAHARSFYAAHASLEQMSRNFNDIFNVQLRPSPADITRLQTTVPNIPGFSFNQTITEVASASNIPIEDGPFAGLVSVRTPWRLDAVATYTPNAQQVQLTRTFFNHQIPLFQFGIFYNDDMELFPGPNFNFGGRVHANGHMFLMAGSDLYFRSRVTAVGQIVRDIAKSGTTLTTGNWTGQVWVADSNNTFRELLVGQGSVVNGPDTVPDNPDMPDGTINGSWASQSAIFTGNLVANTRPLRLPLQIGTNNDPVEMVQRGRDADTPVLRDSRYYNKPGIRITLSDSQSRLPGGAGGVRLDGNADGAGGNNEADGSRGYRPLPMNGGAYQATRLNGHRLYTGPSYTDGGMPANRQTWIKVERVWLDPDTLAPLSQDITSDILSLGLTESAPQLFGAAAPNDRGQGNRAIIKMQRYVIPGPPVRVAASDLTTSTTNPTAVTANVTVRPDARLVTQFLPAYSYSANADPLLAYNFVATSRSTDSGATWTPYNFTTAQLWDVSEPTTAETGAHEVTAGNYRVVPFPIKIFDTREGLYNEDMPTTGTGSWTVLYTDATGVNAPVNGNMSIIDIDMRNLSLFLSGLWDGQFPANAALPGGSLSSDDIDNNGGVGWIVYVSDRRGDRDNDGVYDMEDIFGGNDGVMQPGEDVNRDGVLQADYGWEAERYSVAIRTDEAAVYDHRYYRRGVRVINGQQLSGTVTLPAGLGGGTRTLPGTLNRGFTVAAENGLYLLGNYNASGVSSVGDPSQPNTYQGGEVPTSLVSDAITILSNNWQDSRTFRNPFRTGTRSATQTTVRTALLMGDTISNQVRTGIANQGGKDKGLNGGVHNFPRFLESWPVRLNYCGSLINLFNSRNNTGAFKCCQGNVYGAPTRNWVFNTAFLDINRLPPGTPFFQFAQLTGFRQTIRQLQ